MRKVTDKKPVGQFKYRIDITLPTLNTSGAHKRMCFGYIDSSTKDAEQKVRRVERLITQAAEELDNCEIYSVLVTEDYN